MSRGGPNTATINGRPIAVGPRETLLQAARREGLAFPHGCRVGGCATCRCLLVEGRVRELTETASLLSDEELDRGVILACQAVPRGDVRVEVDAMSLVLVAAAFALSGWRGALFFTACAAWGKALLEIVNYMEHYGMVRDPATPVKPRRSERLLAAAANARSGLPGLLLQCAPRAGRP